MLQEEYDALNNELSNLKNKRDEFEEKLKQSYSKEDIIECKYQIKRINKEIPRLEEKQRILSKKIREQKEKDFLYKKLYVELDDDLLYAFNQNFDLSMNSEEYTIKYLINNYSKYQIYSWINFLKILSPSERDNFIKTMRTQNIHVDVLIERYNNSDTIEKLNPEIKDIILEVENQLDLKFNGIDRYKVLFIKDLSQMVDLESFLLIEFEDYCKDYLPEIYNEENECDASWEEISEYDKLRLIPVDNCLEEYCMGLEDEVGVIVERKFDFEVDVKIPKNTTPISLQTSEYFNRITFKKNVERYTKLINEKRK